MSLLRKAFAARDAEQHSLYAELLEFQRRADERDKQIHASLSGTLRRGVMVDNGAGACAGGFGNRDYATPSPVNRELSSPSPFDALSPPLRRLRLVHLVS